MYRPVEHDNSGERGEAQHPEPQEDVDLLVEYVEGQDAQRVMLLQLTRATKLVEGALCQPAIYVP